MCRLEERVKTRATRWSRGTLRHFYTPCSARHELFDAAPGMLVICLVTWQVAAEWQQKQSLREMNSEAVSSVAGQD